MLSHPVRLMVNAEAGAEGVAAEAEAAVWCTRSLLQLLWWLQRQVDHHWRWLQRQVDHQRRWLQYIHVQELHRR